MSDVMAARDDDSSAVATLPPEHERYRRLLDDRVAKSETTGGVTRLQHRENRGAGGAVKTGYLAALAAGVDVVATIDGDGQMDSDYLPALLDPVVAGRAGYAKGDRFSERSVVREMPPFRLFGNLLLTGLTRISSGYWGVSDPQNGFTAISRDVLLELDVARLPEYYGYMNHLMADLNVSSVDIADVPMPARYGDEESHIDYHQYIRCVSVLLLDSFLGRLRTKYGRRRLHPAPVCYAFGGAVGVATTFRFLWSALRDEGVSYTRRKRAVIFASVVLAFVLAAVTDWMSGPFAFKERVTRERRLTGRAGQEGPDVE